MRLGSRGAVGSARRMVKAAAGGLGGLALIGAVLAMPVLAMAVPGGPARAEDTPILQVTPAPPQVDTDMLVVTGGFYDFNLKDNESVEFGLEYRSDYQLFIVKPFVGASVNTDGSLYGYAGILSDLVLFDRLVLTPSFAAGAWKQGNSSAKDLGYWLEFRSQIELTAHLGGGIRAGAYFNHVSNAGLGDTNPGVEVIGATFIVPLRALF